MARLAFAIALLVAAQANAAPPDDVPERTARFEDDGRHITITINYPDLLDAALRKRLDSGLATTLVTRAYLFREGGRAEALAIQTVRVAYDLWDEVYVVEVTDRRGRRAFRERGQAAAIARATLVDRLPLVESARLEVNARALAAVIVEVNPVSPELLAQVRRWLARPRTDAGPDGESLFGSFVSIFVNTRVGDAEKVLRFRTQPFFRTAAPSVKP
jgi:hypothetical protein